MKVDVISHVDEVIDELNNKESVILEMLGIAGEKNAKAEITQVVYDTPRGKSGYKRTGNLRNSLTHKAVPAEHSVHIGTNRNYGKYVELGTSKMKPRPYLKPAILNNMDEYKRIIQSQLER